MTKQEFIEHMNTERPRVKISVRDKDINYFVVNSKGKIVDSGEYITRVKKVGNKKISYQEKGDTFQDSFLDLKSIDLNKKPMITFNRNVFTELNYEIYNIEPA